jgi:hypothetical protein
MAYTTNKTIITYIHWIDMHRYNYVIGWLFVQVSLLGREPDTGMSLMQQIRTPTI